MPRKFKLTTEVQKYDNSQDPKTWLKDYLTAVKCQKGSKTTAMQYLNLLLTGSTRTWLENRPRGYYRSWDELECDFEKNFRATCKRPASIEELRSRRQDKGETIHSYIQRWTTLKNSATDISEESVIWAFMEGVRRSALREEFGRQKPKTIGKMMEVADRWADGEESVRNDQGRSPGDDGEGNRNSERRKRGKTREGGDADFIAAEFSKSRDGGYRRNRDWKQKPEEQPISEQLEEYCSFHAYRDKETGKLKSTHLLKNCRKLQMINQALNQNQQQAISQGTR